MDRCSAQSGAFSSCLPPAAHGKKGACSCEVSGVGMGSVVVVGGGGGVTFIAFFPMNFNIRSFGLRHYLEETAFSLWHFFLKKMHFCPAPYLLLFDLLLRRRFLKYSAFRATRRHDHYGSTYAWD